MTVLPPPPLLLFFFLHLRRGTIGAGEIVEAISDPKRATAFAARLRDLIKANPATDDRVRKKSKLSKHHRQRASYQHAKAVFSSVVRVTLRLGSADEKCSVGGGLRTPKLTFARFFRVPP